MSTDRAARATARDQVRKRKIVRKIPKAKKKAKKKEAKKKEWFCGVCENQNRYDYTYCKACNIAKGALELDKAWVCGTSDTRVRAAILFRAIAHLYRYRGEDADNGRAMHWNKTAIMISALPHSLATQTQVEELISIRGIGLATIHLMGEIFLTGFVDYIDDLLHEVRNLSKNCTRESAVASIGAIEERVHRLVTISPEQRRAFRREKALAFAQRRAEQQQRQSRSRGESDDDSSSSSSSSSSYSSNGGGRADSTIQKGIRLTGAKRRMALAKHTPSKQHTHQKMQGNPQTRSGAELERLVVALRGADETDVCAICLEVYEDAHELVAFDCRHCFHFECAHQWLTSVMAAGVQPCCPLCRTSIKL